MTFLETVKYARTIIDLVDANDEKVINILEVISNLPMMPSYVKVAVSFLKNIEGSVVKILISAIELAEKVAGTSQEKLQKATDEVKGQADINLINKGVEIVNSFIKKV